MTKSRGFYSLCSGYSTEVTAGDTKRREPGWHKTAVYAVDGLIGSLTSDIFERRHVNR